MNVELHSDVELQNIGNAHSDFENNTHEGNEELPKGNMNENWDAERNDMETRKEPRLEKYVRRHHLAEQIIGDKNPDQWKGIY